MKTILFQGDSITDAGRNREDGKSLGQGYACMVAGKLGLKYPGEYLFLNRGIGGDRIDEVDLRWYADIAAINPDILSVLVGVNDSSYDGDKYEKRYSDMIARTKEMMPHTKIVMLEPFIFLNSIIMLTDEWGKVAPNTFDRAASAKRVAEKHNIPFITLQDKFNEAAKLAPERYWLSDGVHPTAAGHALICDAWIDTFEKHLK